MQQQIQQVLGQTLAPDPVRLRATYLMHMSKTLLRMR
jgi:hypothetical protein